MSSSSRLRYHSSIGQALRRRPGLKALCRIKHHFADHRPISGERLSNRLAAALGDDLNRWQPVGGGDPFLHVRERHAVARSHASMNLCEKRFLRCADRKIPVVIQHEKLHGQAIFDQRLKLLNVELKASVARQTDNALAFACDRGADGGGQIVTHRCRAGITDQPLSFLESRHVDKANNAGRGIAAHDHVISGHDSSESASTK